MRKGLVMEGGAMRGMFTCGVIDVLMENGIDFDGAVGVSAGATFGINYKSKQIGRAVRYNKKYCTDKRYHSIRSLLLTGDIYNVPFCYDELPYKLDKWDIKTFKENPMEFYCVATDINTGKPAYHKCTDGEKEDITWIQASASMPLVSRPVHIDGGVYLDGGPSDSIPLKFMEDKGYERILVIETQPGDYVKGHQKFMPLVKVMLRRYPNMIECMEKRHLMYNEEKRYIRDKEKSGEVLVIRPDEPLNISPVEKDPAELERVYQLGRAAGQKKLEAIKEYFKA
jgi:predicted patatin/cPLA2 family phospholipase